MASEIGAGLARVVDKPLALPASKAECQRVLRRLGFRGLKIDAIDAGMHRGLPLHAPRVYALTRPRWVGPNEWRRDALTLVFLDEGRSVRVRALDGWVVD